MLPCCQLFKCNKRFPSWMAKLSTQTCPEWKLVFFGTDDFALPHLKALQNLQMENSNIVRKITVITKQKCLVHKYAEENGIENSFWPVKDLPESDLGILVSFGHLLPASIIQQVKQGIINVHPSLLPRWRGAAPMVHTVLSGDTCTGVSIMKIKPYKFDTGEILMQQKVNDLRSDVNLVDLKNQLSAIGCQLLVHVLKNWHNLAAVQQSDSQVTAAPKVVVTHSNLNWIDSTMKQIDRQYRSIGLMFGLRTKYDGRSIQLLDMIKYDEMNSAILPEIEAETRFQHLWQPGYAFYHKRREVICVKCKDGWVAFTSVVFKKKMTAKAFYNGYLSKQNNKNCVFASLDNRLKSLSHWTDEDNRCRL